MKLRNTTKLFSILLCLSVTDAVRGGKSLRRGGESLPQHNTRRRAELKVFKTGAAEIDSQEEISEESYDDPEETVGGGKKGGGKIKGSTPIREGNAEAEGLPEVVYEEPVDQEPLYDSEDIAAVVVGREGGVAKQGGKNKGTKTPREESGEESGEESEEAKDSGGNKGSGTAKGEGVAEDEQEEEGEELIEPVYDSEVVEEEEELNEPMYDSEDMYLTPDDPETSEPEPEQDNPDDPDDPLWGFPPLEQSSSATIEREIPSLSIQYSIRSTSSPDGDDGNYNELAVVTEEYLDESFNTLFEPTPAHHAFTAVRLHKTGDPLVVDIQVGANFFIPGEVPTPAFMFDKIREKFVGTEAEGYLKQLSEMSSTNPFSSTVSIEIITHQPGHISGNGLPKPRDPAAIVKKKSVMGPFLAGIGFLVVVIVGFLWVRRRRGDKDIEISHQVTLDEEDQSRTMDANDEEKGFTTAHYTTQLYGPDDETLRYLNSVREQYSKEDDAISSRSTDLEDVSLDDDNTEEEVNMPASIEDEDCMRTTETLSASTDDRVLEQGPSQETDQIEEDLSDEDELHSANSKLPDTEASDQEIADDSQQEQELETTEAALGVAGKISERMDSTLLEECRPKNTPETELNMDNTILEECPPEHTPGTELNTSLEEDISNNDIEMETDTTKNKTEKEREHKIEEAGNFTQKEDAKEVFNYLKLDSSFDEDLRSE